MKTEQTFSGKRVAILATGGFEQDELLSPLKALKNAGANGGRRGAAFADDEIHQPDRSALAIHNAGH
jgi:putative intracellular protease/amidase